MRGTIFLLILWHLCGEVFCQTHVIMSQESDENKLYDEKNTHIAQETSYATVNLTSTNLPIFIINTIDNQRIPDEPKIMATLGIIYNGPGEINKITDNYNHYDGYIGIELRGNSTQNYPKKPYSIETRNIDGENFNASLLAMPEENDWVLRASYFDHTFIRNQLADHMSRLNGNWASRCRLVELVLNGDYQGIYILMEKIKPDKNRLDIADLFPAEIAEPDITGGYIYEITGFNDNLGESRNLKYPKYQEAANQQIAYIKQYDDNFRSVMRSDNYMDLDVGYHAWINVESFVDELIVQEAMRNSDAYGWSGYFNKDKNGKINAGPVWDFDQSAGNSSYPDDGVYTGWMFNHENTNNTPFFWSLLFDDPVFKYEVKKKWEKLRENEYKTLKLFAYIDSIADILSEAQQREFEKWPVLGESVWRETKGFEQRDTYQKEVDYLKNFLSQRWSWMDSELAKIPNPNPAIIIDQVFSDMLVYPNPAKDNIIFQFNSKNNITCSIHIYNNLGMLIQKSALINLSQGNTIYSINLNKLLHSGIYFYKVFVNDKLEYTGKFVKTD